MLVYTHVHAHVHTHVYTLPLGIAVRMPMQTHRCLECAALRDIDVFGEFVPILQGVRFFFLSALDSLALCLGGGLKEEGAAATWLGAEARFMSMPDGSAALPLREEFEKSIYRQCKATAYEG